MVTLLPSGERGPDPRMCRRSPRLTLVDFTAVLAKRTHRRLGAAQTPSRETDILCRESLLTYNRSPGADARVASDAAKRPPTFMRRPRRRNPVAIALYVNAALLVAILGVLLARDSSQPMLPTALGQGQPPPIAGGNGVYLMPAQFSGSVFGCYIMDTSEQTLCAYTVSGSPPQLRLVAARTF